MIDENFDDLLSVDAILGHTLKDIGIPSRPEIIDRISAEMIKEDPNFRHLGQLIGADVSLSAALIKTANSPFFGYHSRAQSINEALMLLGLDVASQAIAGISLRHAFSFDVNLEKFLHTSAQIAALSGWLARDFGRGGVRADAAYTYGLFRDCGIPVMLRRFPGYDKTLARASGDALQPFTEVERNELPDFPVDHALVGSLLAQSWWLPEETCAAIRHHHETSALDPADAALSARSRRIIAIGQTAEHILQQITDCRDNCEWMKLGDRCLSLLGIGEDDLPALYQEGAELLQKMD